MRVSLMHAGYTNKPSYYCIIINTANKMVGDATVALIKQRRLVTYTFVVDQTRIK